MLNNITAEELAKLRRDTHKTSSNARMDKKNPYKEDTLGAEGELFFGNKYSLAVDISSRPQGDDYDFKLYVDKEPIYIDVKTTETGDNLLIKQNDILSQEVDILVLVRKKNKTLEMAGWIHKDDVLKAPTKPSNFKDRWGNEQLNYVVAPSKLHPSNKLDRFFEIYKPVQETGDHLCKLT